MPAAIQRYDNESDIENGDVAEKAQGIVLTRREQNRRQKTAEHAQDGHNHCVQPRCQQEGRRRDQHHEQKCRYRIEKWKMIIRTTRKGDGIKNHDPRCAQRLRKCGEIPA